MQIVQQENFKIKVELQNKRNYFDDLAIVARGDCPHPWRWTIRSKLYCDWLFDMQTKSYITLWIEGYVAFKCTYCGGGHWLVNV